MHTLFAQRCPPSLQCPDPRCEQCPGGVCAVCNEADYTAEGEPLLFLDPATKACKECGGGLKRDGPCMRCADQRCAECKQAHFLDASGECQRKWGRWQYSGAWGAGGGR